MRLLILLMFLIPLSGFTQELKLLTWNVYMIPKPIRLTKQGTRATMIKKVLAETPHDVIVLEEAFSFVFRNRIKSALKKSHPYQSKLGRGKLIFLNSGVFIASRYPFKVLETIHYEECAVMDCLAGKGLILIEVEHPSGKKVQIAATHMQAEEKPKAIEARRDQFKMIASLLAKHKVPGIAQIVTGDLNVNALSKKENPEMADILSILDMQSGPLTGEIQHTSGYNLDCYNVDKSTENTWLDHILLAPNESQTQVVERKVLPFLVKFVDQVCPLSDHYGLEAVIKL